MISLNLVVFVLFSQSIFVIAFKNDLNSDSELVAEQVHQVGLFQDLFGLVDKTNGDCEVDSNVFTANYFGPCNAKGIAIKLKYNDKMPEFDANQMTVVIVHGWTSEYTKGGWMDRVRETLMEMKNNKLNVFAMDWNPTAANKLYPIPAKKTRKVGHEIAKYIHKLGIKADKVICIGHSLGAHVCGGFGEQYIKLEAKIYKIWGLDPANPMFNGKNDFRLCKEHAHLVEVIHTNGGDLGIKKAIGHFDFYLNNGEIQPKCKKIKASDEPDCDHGRAYEYLIHPQPSCARIGYRCKDFDSLKDGKCVKCGKNNHNCREIDIFGYPSSGGDCNAAENKFYMLTSGENHDLCRNHYSIEFRTDRGCRYIKGKIELILVGQQGEEKVMEYSRNLIFQSFSPNTKYDLVGLSENSLGKLHKAKLLFTPDFLCTLLKSIKNCYLEVAEIEVNFEGDLNPNNRLLGSAKFCNPKSCKNNDNKQEITFTVC